jgi:solute carrier family 25 uncoupling protein 27
MQADGRLVASGQITAPRYSGLTDAFTTIAKSEGAVGFYRGCWPAIQRAALVNLGELTTYDTAKKYLVVRMGDTTLCHVCAAVCSGFVASLCSTPADVAKSRIMGQVPLPDGTLPYRGTLDCWRKVKGTPPPREMEHQCCRVIIFWGRYI